MRRVALIFMVFALAVLMGCGGGNSSSTPPSTGGVTVTPTTASVPINTTTQFSATVTSGTSGVVWTVNDIGGGNSTVGTISSTGLYTAPAVVPSPATVTVKAISAADTTKFASATVTIAAGTSITLSIAPTTASVYTSRTLQFTPTINTSVNTGISWAVNSVIGGDATNGTITTTGLYTAPATVPSTATVTITAISQADTTKTATASVTILLGTTIVVKPASATVPAGTQQTFTAQVNGSPVAVTWSLNCNSSEAGACGAIDTSGVYTAPATPPPGGVVSITATSTDNSALPAGAAVTVVTGNGTLAGQYAFSITGKQGSTAYVEAGSITLDGSGNITGGIEDLNNGTATSTAITGGTYHVGADGRGSAVVQTAAGTENWQLVVRDHSHVRMIRADASATGSGALDLQDASAFATSLQGKYTLLLTGATAGQAASVAMAGAVNADGAGAFSSGSLDVATLTTASTSLALAGTYGAASAAGRGTMTLASTNGAQSFVYFIVDVDHIRLLETDANRLAGTLVRQPASTTLAGLAGAYAFLTSGNSTAGPIAVGGVVAVDGAGAVTGSGDSNLNGNWQNAIPITGTLQITDATNARVEWALSYNGQNRKFAAYPQIDSSLALVEIDGSGSAAGVAFLQNNPALSSSFQGSFGTLLAGTDFLNGSSELDALGLVTPNGGSAWTGVLDINAGGTVSHSVSATGSYLSSSTVGRGTGTLQTGATALSSAQVVLYVVDANRVLILETDGSRVLTGTMEK